MVLATVSEGGRQAVEGPTLTIFHSDLEVTHDLQLVPWSYLDQRVRTCNRTVCSKGRRTRNAPLMAEVATMLVSMPCFPVVPSALTLPLMVICFHRQLGRGGGI